MRVREPFAAERQSEISEYRKKYFIASEGATTEPQYFEKLNNLILKENTTIINLLRDYANQGHSNPTHVIKLLQTFIDNSGTEITVEELKNKISNWDHENQGKINLEEVLLKIDQKYNNDGFRIKNEELEELFMELFKSDVYSDLANNFERYFEAQDVTYSPSVDSLNMVIDRDRESFTEKQYDEVISFCNKNNVNLYVSNPNFELWLLMHFDEIENEDNNVLFENKKVNNSGRRYIERRLHNICGYRKNYVPFDKLHNKIKDAIKREKNYCEDIIKLKDALGTNIGILVEKIINEK